MRAGTIARVYAETLLRQADREGALAEVDEGLASVAALTESDERFRRFLVAPQIDADDKRATLAAILDGRVHPLVVRFLRLVVDKRRETVLDEIVTAWRDLLDRRRNRQSATVATALPVDDALLARIRESIEEATGKTIDLDQEVDPSLLGGVVIRTGDTVIDGSVRTRLATLRRRMRSVAVAGSPARTSSP